MQCFHLWMFAPVFVVLLLLVTLLLNTLNVRISCTATVPVGWGKWEKIGEFVQGKVGKKNKKID